MGKRIAAPKKSKPKENTKDALAKLTERLNLATHAAQIGIWDWDIQKNELIWDDQMYRLYGLQSGDFGGAYEAWLNGLHPDDRAASDAVTQTALRGEKEYDTEFRVLWPDGNIHWLKANGQVFRDEEGKPIRMLGVNYDITARKQTETDLYENEEKFAALFYQAAIPAVLLALPERAAADVNTAFENMSGYGRQEILGKNPVQIGMAPSTETQRAFHEFQEKGSLFGAEGRFFTKTGDARDVLINANLVELGGRKYAVLTYQDITDRKIAEEKLEQSEERFSKAFHSTPVGLTLSRLADSKFEFANQSFLTLTGYKLNEIIDKNPFELNLFPNPADIASIREIVVKTGKVRNLETALRVKTGEIRSVTFSVDVVHLYGELYSLTTLVDITERKQAEKQVLQMKRLYATLSQVNQTIVRVKDQAELYRSICEVSTKFGEFVLAWVGILDHETGDVKPAAASGLDLAQWPFPQINIHEGMFKNGLIATAIRTSQVVTSEDISTDVRTNTSRSSFLSYDYHSTAIVPFQLRGTTIGILSLVSREAELFNAQEEVLLLKEMGGDISFALDTLETEKERKQAEEQLRMQDIRLKILADASKSFAASGQGYQSVLDQVVRQISNALADMCVIRMLSDDKQFLELTAIYSRDPDFTNKLQKIDEHTDDSGMAQYVFKTGKPALIPIITLEQLLASLPPEYKEIDPRFAPHSYIVVPLRVQEQIIGILALTRYRAEQPSFTEDDLAVAQDLADRAAMVINNVQLFDLVQKELEVRKNTENSLREREQKLNTILNLLPVGISILDQDQKVAYSNEALGKILEINKEGLSRGEYHNRKYLRADGSEKPANEFASAQAFTEKTQILDAITGIVKEDNQTIWTSVSATPVDFPDWKLILVTSDITKRKYSEEKIQEQLRRLNGLHEIDRAITSELEVETTLKVVIEQTLSLLNADAAMVLLFNESTQTLDYAAGKGFRSPLAHRSRLHLGEGLAGRIGLERKVLYIPDLSRPDVPFIRAGLFQDDQFVEYVGVPLDAKGKLKGILEIFNRTAMNPDEEWLHFLDVLGEQAAIAIDNSQLFKELERTNAELEQRIQIRTADLLHMNAELEHANQAKDEFLANMSHELRTPLTGILGLSEALQLGTYGSTNEKQVKALKNIEFSGKHLLALINDILDLAKIEAGKFDISPEMIGLDDICQSSLIFVKQQAQKKSIDLEYLGTEAAKSIVADPRRLKQILVNLLSNAVKFTPEGGSVTLSVKADPQTGKIHFTVTDTGIGIAKADLDRLFTPFTQVDSQLNRQYEGTGLGLVLVLRLAEMHGGSVQVESEVGKGSSFTVSLPWQSQIEMQDHSPEERNTETATVETNSPGVLLLVEDNPMNIETIGDFLTFKGYTVVIARNGMEALIKAEEHNPQLILMDIQMPVMDGLEATRRLRADPRFASTPVIALTALAMSSDRERCFDAGANDFISKPVSLKELIKKIETLLQT